MEGIPASSEEASNYVELICHLGAYSSVLTLVNGYTADQLDRLSHAVREMYPAQTISIHASSLGLGYSIEQRLAEYFQINPMQAGSNTRRLIVECAQQTGSSDPVLVVIERGDLMTIDQLMEASELSLVAPQLISFCVLGMNDFDHGLSGQKGAAHIYRISLQPPAGMNSPVPPAPVRDDLAFADHAPDQGEEFQNEPAEPVGFVGTVREKLESFIPQSYRQNDDVEGVERQFPTMHLIALGLVLLILVVSLLDLLFEDEAPPAPVTPVEVRSLDIAERPAFSPDSQFKEEDTEASQKPQSQSSFKAPSVSKGSNSADQYQLLETTSKSKVTSPPAPAVTKTNSRIAESRVVTSDGGSAVLAGNGYLVQLMAAENISGADEFIARWGESVPGDLHRQKTIRKGKVWFIVFMAPYETRNEANADIALLPSSLKRQKPWIRPVADVRKIASYR